MTKVYFLTDFRLEDIFIDNYNYEEKQNVEQIIKENPDNLEIINSVINKNYDAFKYVSDRLKKNSKFVKFIVSKKGLLINYVSNNLKNNFVIAKIAIMNDVRSYIYISNELQNNNDIIDLVITSNKYLFDIITLFDKSVLTIDLINRIIDNSLITSNFIEYIPNELLTKEIIIKIINNAPLSTINKIPLDLFDNDIILNIIKNNNLKNLKCYLEKNNIQITDISLILKALEINFEYINYISKELLNNKEFVMKILSINGDFILNISDELKNDCHVIIHAINHCKHITEYNHILLYNQVWNIQWNFNKFEKNYIEILENMKYMPFTENIGILLDNILSQHDILSDKEYKKLITEKYSKYLTDILIYNNDKNEEYIIWFEKYNIRCFNFNEVKPLDCDEIADEERITIIKTEYENENKNNKKIILWY